MPGLPTLLQEASTSSSLPFQLSARMSDRASPVPNLNGPGSQHHPSHEGRSGAATLLLRPWGSAVRGTEALWPLPGSKPWGGGEVSDPGRRWSHDHVCRGPSLRPTSLEGPQCWGWGAPKG